MAEIPIADEDREQIARMQHVLEWLQEERARLSDELRVLSSRGQSVQNDLLAFVAARYRIPAGAAITFDSARGVLALPDIPAVVVSAPAPSPSATAGESAAGDATARGDKRGHPK